MPSYSFREPGTAYSAQLIGQIDRTEPSTPVSGLFSRDRTDKIWPVVLDKEEELVGAIHFVGHVVRIAMLGEVTVLGEDQVGSTRDGRRVHVTVFFIAAGKCAIDTEIIHPATSKGRGKAVTNAGDLTS